MLHHKYNQRQVKNFMICKRAVLADTGKQASRQFWSKSVRFEARFTISYEFPSKEIIQLDDLTSSGHDEGYGRPRLSSRSPASKKISLVGDASALSLLPGWHVFSLLELAWPQGAGLLSCDISALSA